MQSKVKIKEADFNSLKWKEEFWLQVPSLMRDIE